VAATRELRAPTTPAPTRFEFGLQRVLDGIEAHLTG
jgi:hypothetical protein